MRVYFVLGEVSGDALAADLLDALRAQGEVEAVGLAGARLQAGGVRSLFDISEIAVMGIGAVLSRLPNIVRRVHQTVADIVRSRPDVVVLVDAPDFTHAVAKRVRRKRPGIPIIDYVCPSVWAWRQERARRMAAYVDHVLCLLPFEPERLRELGGPAATYVGHPLAGIAAKVPVPAGNALLVLPGSRASEVERLLPVFGETLSVLHRRGFDAPVRVPAVAHLRDRIEHATSGWIGDVEVVSSGPGAFEDARAALAASGTVALELALHRVPMVLAYEFDAFARQLTFLIKTWSGALPNHIADRVIVPENVDGFVKPERLARQVEAIFADTPDRAAQLSGLDEVRRKVSVDRPAGEVAADVVRGFVEGGRDQSMI